MHNRSGRSTIVGGASRGLGHGAAADIAPADLRNGTGLLKLP
jgi:hypothetical protein